MILLYALQIIILLAVGGVILVLLVNIITVPRLEKYPPPVNHPPISILIPARNEEQTIERCVRSCLAQKYPALEVIVLDDHSTDATWPILTRLAATNPRLKIVRGQPLPEGWMGKHWACQQLGQLAGGEFLLFTDADVWFDPQMATHAIAAAQAEQADLLAALPREVVGSWAERLVVPLLNFAMLLVFPYPLARRVPWPFMLLVNGQFMLFRREAYHQINGFSAVRKGVLDVQMGRRLKAAGYRWRLANATQSVFCRMYTTAAAVWRGFSKGMYPSFDYNLPGFLLPLLGLGLCTLTPLALRLLAAGGYPLPGNLLFLADLAMGLALLAAGLFYAWLKIPLYVALFYPVSVTLAIIIGLNSIYVTLTGRGQWKGRPYLPAD